MAHPILVRYTVCSQSFCSSLNQRSEYFNYYCHLFTKTRIDPAFYLFICLFVYLFTRPYFTGGFLLQALGCFLVFLSCGVTVCYSRSICSSVKSDRFVLLSNTHADRTLHPLAGLVFCCCGPRPFPFCSLASIQCF